MATRQIQCGDKKKTATANLVFREKWFGLVFYIFFLHTLIPCILDIALRGLRALRVLIVLKAWMPPAPTRDATKFMRETWSYHKDNTVVLELFIRWVETRCRWKRGIGRRTRRRLARGSSSIRKRDLGHSDLQLKMLMVQKRTWNEWGVSESKVWKKGGGNFLWAWNRVKHRVLGAQCHGLAQALLRRGCSAQAAPRPAEQRSTQHVAGHLAHTT